MSEDWMPDDPFASPDDPAAREREQRRREREERRHQRETKQAKKNAPAPPPSEPAESPAPSRRPEPAQQPVAAEPEPAKPAAAPPPARTAEQVFWDEPAPAPDEGLPPEQTPVAARISSEGRRSGDGGVFGRVRRHPLLIVTIVIALLVVWFLGALFQPFHGDGSGRVAVAIPKGASVSEVGDILGDKGVIDSSTMFQIRATLAGQRSELYPGHYTLAHGMSYGAALDALSQPPLKRVLSVTIPEGYSRSQAAQLVEEDGLEGDYTKETVRSKYLDPAKYGGKGAEDLEGFLFPDTFELKPGAPAADLVQLQLQDFKRRIGGST